MPGENDDGLITEQEAQNAVRYMEDQEQGDSAESQQAQQARPQQEEEPDYKTEAAYLRGRLEAQQQGGGQQEQRLDPVAEVERKIAEKQANLPQFNQERPESFFEREAALEELRELRERKLELKLEQQQRTVMETQAYTAVQNYKQRWANDPVFQQVEQDFDAAVQQLDPGVRRNPAMLEMIRKNFMFDAIQNQQSGRKMPPQAPNQAGRTQMEQSQRQQEQEVRWKNDLDRQLGQHYGMSAREFYTEPALDADGNGIQIYDMPRTGRGRKA